MTVVGDTHGQVCSEQRSITLATAGHAQASPYIRRHLATAADDKLLHSAIHAHSDYRAQSSRIAFLAWHLARSAWHHSGGRAQPAGPYVGIWFVSASHCRAPARPRPRFSSKTSAASS